LETGGSFYRNQNFENCPMDYSTENTGFAQRNAVAGVGMEDARMYDGLNRDNHTLSEVAATGIRAQIRMYGGHTGNDHPQAPMNPYSSTDKNVRTTEHTDKRTPRIWRHTVDFNFLAWSFVFGFNREVHGGHVYSPPSS
jgi:hypothetical protein